MTNSDTEIRQPIDSATIINAIKRQVGSDLASHVTLSSRLHQDLGLTSFDYMQLLDEFEYDGNEDFDFDLAMKASTVQDLVDALSAPDAASKHLSEDGR